MRDRRGEPLTELLGETGLAATSTADNRDPIYGTSPYQPAE